MPLPTDDTVTSTPAIHSRQLETVETLKLCLGARAQLAGWRQCLRQSNLRTSTLAAIQCAESAGLGDGRGYGVHGHADLRTLLLMSASARDAITVRRTQTLHALDAHTSSQVSANVRALDLAESLAGEPVSLRRETGRSSEALQKQLDDWQQFMDQDAGDLEPLLLYAVSLAWWHDLSPLTMANPETGHVLGSALLIEEGLLDSVCVPLALRYARQRDTVDNLMQAAWTDQQWQPWFGFVVRQLFNCAADLTQWLMQLETWSSDWLDEVVDALPAKAPAQAVLAACLAPSVGIAELVEQGVAHRQTAGQYMKRLQQAGFCEEHRVGKEKRYLIEPVMEGWVSVLGGQ